MNNSLGRIKSNFTKYSELFYTSRKHTVSFHTKTLTFNFKAIGALRKSPTALDSFVQFSTLIILSNPANSQSWALKQNVMVMKTKKKKLFFGKKNKNFIAGQKQYKNLKRTFIFGQLVTQKDFYFCHSQKILITWFFFR